MYIDSIKSRLRVFVDHLGIDRRAFHKSIGVADGFLNSDSEPNSSAVSSVIKTYPQLSPDWLLTGEGEMLRNMKEHPSVVNISEDANEPARPYTRPAREMQQQNSKDFITLPIAVWNELRQQLQNKDDQIATLLTKLP